MTDDKSAQFGLVLTNPVEQAEETLLHAEQVLEPGYYWTAKSDIPMAKGPDISTGETMLLVELVEFEGQLHSVVLLYHPEHGEGRHTFLIKDFLSKFDPCRDGDEVRSAEQQRILDLVGELQRELVETQANPHLMLEAVKPQVEKEAAARAREEEAQAKRDAAAARERDQNISKIHRRAARRSAANGNPLALPKVAVGTNVSQLLRSGIDEGGVLQLQEIAARQLVMANAQANWLKTKTEEIGKTLKRLAPYAAEKAAVALARSSDALKRAHTIKQGIESLDLYTGKGVEVFEVRDGAEASSHIPLKIVQGKRFMEEELAAHADVGETFDWQNQGQFFAELAANQALLEQVFPSERCVISMAVTRRTRRYEDAFASMINNMRNLAVFLLVRNGGKVYVVYSATPSHEAANRLFPTKNELGQVFRGMDGSRITLRDVEFGEHSKRFDDLALHYRRFLILLCGLDHRQKLFGDFYPPEQQTNFMTGDFQDRYMDFYADEENESQLGDGMPSVDRWISQKNLMVQSGSRVFVTNSSGASSNCAELRRRPGLRLRNRQFESPFLASQEGLRYLVSLETTLAYGHGSEPNVKCYLEGKTEDGDVSNWWLCLDDVKASEVQRYLSSRNNWAMGVSYLRLFRRLVVYLAAEAEREAPSRRYLITQATTHGGMPMDVATDAMDMAVRNWRATRRGAALPDEHDTAALNEVLSLMAPPGYLPPAAKSLIDDYLSGPEVAGAQRQPLLLTRSGSNRYILYTTAAPADRAHYPEILAWGWVRRVTLEPSKTGKRLREVSHGFDWLGEVLPASEAEIRRWGDLPAWQHKLAEPIKLKKYAELKSNIAAAAAAWAETLRAGPGSGIPDALFDALAERCRTLQRREKRTVAHLVVAIPVAIYGGPRSMTAVYMAARAEHVLHMYGTLDQKERMERQFVEGVRAGNAHKMVAVLREPLQWAVQATDEFLDGSHLDIHKNGAPGWKVEDRDWLRISPEVNMKRKRGTSAKPGVKGDGKPVTRSVYAIVSMNRAFDELAGVGPLRRRRFYKALMERAASDKRFGWKAHGSDPDGSRSLAARKTTLEQRFLAKPALLSPLVWSVDLRRSIAQSLFDAPLRAAGKLRKPDPKQRNYQHYF